MLFNVGSVCTLLAIAQAAPQFRQDGPQTTPIPILRQENVINPDGSYQWSYETGNGIQAEEQGYLKNVGVEGQEAMVATGRYSYIGEDGVPVEVTYIADENGFRPSGAHLPTPPPIPPEIQASLDLIAAQQAAGGNQDEDNSGAYRPEEYEQPSQNSLRRPVAPSRPAFAPAPSAPSQASNRQQSQREQLQRQNQAYYKTAGK